MHVITLCCTLVFSITSRDTLIYHQNKLSCSRRHETGGHWADRLVGLCYFMQLIVHDINIGIDQEILYWCIPSCNLCILALISCLCLLTFILEFLTVVNIFCLLFKLFIQFKSYSFFLMALLQISFKPHLSLFLTPVFF